MHPWMHHRLCSCTRKVFVVQFWVSWNQIGCNMNVLDVECMNILHFLQKTDTSFKFGGQWPKFVDFMFIELWYRRTFWLEKLFSIEQPCIPVNSVRLHLCSAFALIFTCSLGLDLHWSFNGGASKIYIKVTSNLKSYFLKSDPYAKRKKMGNSASLFDKILLTPYCMHRQS